MAVFTALRARSSGVSIGSCGSLVLVSGDAALGAGVGGGTGMVKGLVCWFGVLEVEESSGNGGLRFGGSGRLDRGGFGSGKVWLRQEVMPAQACFGRTARFNPLPKPSPGLEII